MRVRRGSGRQGFTLLDTLIVVAILGIVGMVAIPAIQGMLRETRLNEATAELVSALQYAGSLAVRHQRPFGFQADASGRWYKVYDNRYAADAAAYPTASPPVTAYGVVLNPLDKSWYQRNFTSTDHYRAVTFTSAQLLFYPDGHSGASNTVCTVSLGGVQRTITVDGSTGRVSVQ